MRHFCCYRDQMRLHVYPVYGPRQPITSKCKFPGKQPCLRRWWDHSPHEVDIAGEIIQNLRSALDHLAYQLFLRAGGTGVGKNILGHMTISWMGGSMK
jgi:hypothetical protein